MTSRAVIAEVFMRRLYPLLLLISLWILLRGHNEPGGGFIGGMLAVAASAGYALVFDASTARQRLPALPLRLAAAGVSIAFGSGLLALLAGQPFLTHQWMTLSLGGLEIPLSTVLVFDAGVYLAVWGAIGGYCLELIEATEEGR